MNTRSCLFRFYVMTLFHIKILTTSSFRNITCISCSIRHVSSVRSRGMLLRFVTAKFLKSSFPIKRLLVLYLKKGKKYISIESFRQHRQTQEVIFLFHLISSKSRSCLIARQALKNRLVVKFYIYIDNRIFAATKAYFFFLRAFSTVNQAAPMWVTEKILNFCYTLRASVRFIDFSFTSLGILIISLR